MPYIGREPLVGDYRKLDDISSSFNGSLTSFVLKIGARNFSPFKSTQVLISLNGVLQEPETAYTITGTTINFNEPPASGSTFFGVALGDTLDIGIPSDNGVTAGKIAAGGISSNSNFANTVVTTHAVKDGAITYSKENRRWRDVSTLGAAPGTTIATGDRCLVGTANGVVNITLPVSGVVQGDEVECLDRDGTWSGNNCTVHSGHSSIMIDSANNIVLDAANTSVRLVYAKSNLWRSQIWS